MIEKSEKIRINTDNIKIIKLEIGIFKWEIETRLNIGAKSKIKKKRKKGDKFLCIFEKIDRVRR